MLKRYIIEVVIRDVADFMESERYRGVKLDFTKRLFYDGSDLMFSNNIKDAILFSQEKTVALAIRPIEKHLLLKHINRRSYDIIVHDCKVAIIPQKTIKIKKYGEE